MDNLNGSNLAVYSVPDDFIWLYLLDCILSRPMENKHSTFWKCTRNLTPATADAGLRAAELIRYAAFERALI